MLFPSMWIIEGIFINTGIIISPPGLSSLVCFYNNSSYNQTIKETEHIPKLPTFSMTLYLL